MEEQNTTPDPLDPILGGQVVNERLSDPLVRALYFGTADSPGFYNQLLSAGKSALSGLEGGLGMYLPFLQESERLGGEAYGTIGQEDIDQFRNPFEDEVVQKTIDDAMRGFDQSEIMQRASNIARGGESAYGSRAGLFAGERARQFGEGLAGALSGIRSQGFNQALANAFQQRNLLGQGAQFQQGLASLAPQLYFQDVMRPLGVLSALGSQLPGYQQGRTDITSQYGLPPDPESQGLGAIFNIYSGFARGQNEQGT